MTETQLLALVAEGLKRGGDWCDLYFEETKYHDLLLRDSEVGAGGFHVDRGCGIRVLKGERTGYAYSESTDFKSLMAAADAASGIADSTAASPVPLEVRRVAGPSFYNEAQPWENAEVSAFIPYLKRLESRIRELDSRVDKVIIMLSYSASSITMFNSLGELTEDFRPLGSISVSAVCKQDGKTRNMNASRSLRCGTEMLTDTLLEELAHNCLDGLDERFEARRPKGGRMSVVMGAGASGILLHEAMGHAFEADFNRKGQSVFCGQVGKRICRKGINIIDDGTLPGNRGAGNFDDEGIAGQKTYMVTDGVLTSYLHDRISAGYYGVEPTGNGRRESFRYNPIPRMRCTYMDSGSDGSVQDLIAGVKHGIYVDKFSNGQVKIGEGDFTFYVQSGKLIENGRLTAPVKDINIIGNGPKALADIVGVASDLKIDDGTWTCGKEQSVSVSCGMPSVLINSLTVGGE